MNQRLVIFICFIVFGLKISCIKCHAYYTHRHSCHIAQSQRYKQPWEKFLHARNMESVEFMIQLVCITQIINSIYWNITKYHNLPESIYRAGENRNHDPTQQLTHRMISFSYSISPLCWKIWRIFRAGVSSVDFSSE